MTAVHLWLRHEPRPTERRTPVVPADARRLIEHGITLTVEDSPQRIFPTGEYEAVGAQVAPAGSWVAAPDDAVILGLKELPDDPDELTHRHIFFGHAYKQQPDAEALLTRFAAGGGALLDLEYLVDDTGRRLAAFGYWAGYLGAALAVLHHRGRLAAELTPTDEKALGELLSPDSGDRDISALVIGALGRSGRGARDALAAAGISPTTWDLAETQDLDRDALLAHDLLVNCVLATSPVPPFVRPQDLDAPGRRLRTVSDVTCDVGSPLNVLPVYDRTTEWADPVRRLRDEPPFDLIAIDNLPSLLPLESSTDFSASLLPQLLDFRTDSGPWGRCLARFASASRELGIKQG
ncbi:saccharopine dehydrogenase [Streptomyces roseirectus]|uniref:Saccharopine dehydrogenase [NAD(+), L-lysine-forming] n=1 Tax=Streptomyces roseirectus TaxID=2768066 RepID=A0A7H0I8R3_9ACTN|nr:saccharopine dehydrogenase [Streptomyces roseirectus]QNP69179.1 saccharopine dehydrogenase [Streptomyces roseirectus]